MKLEILRGNGIILQSGKELISGLYDIKRLTGPDVISHLFGTFYMTEINDNLQLDKLSTHPLPELTLILEDKTEYKINLVNNQFDATSYEILFIV